MSKIIILLVVVTLVGIGAVVAINKNEEAKVKEAAGQAAKKASEQEAKEVMKYDAALMRESARAIGNNVRPDDVQLQNVDRGISLVTWDAATQEVVYNCHADDLLRIVSCVKKNK